MNIKTRIIATSCVIVLWFNNLSILAQTQQNPNLDFGNPTTEEMKMTSCSVEPNAPAVVLCKLDNVNYEIRDNDFCVVYDIKERIKILKPEGKDYANVSINYVDFQENPMNSEKISGLKAVAFNMTDGKIVKSKMDDKLVFRERLDKEDMLIKFTVPQVKVGTVIEYQYKIVSPLYYNIRNWYAQTSIPTMYSYYHLVVPEYFQFNMENTSIYKMEQKLNPIGCAFNYNGEV